MKLVGISKKKRILFVLVSLVLIAIVGLGAWYVSPKTFLKDVDPYDVASISVFDGSTGKRFTIEDPSEIQRVVENIQAIEMKRAQISSHYDGFTFSLSFRDADGNVVDSFIVNSANTIRDDPFFYRCDGELCYDYLQALREQYAPNEVQN